MNVRSNKFMAKAISLLMALILWLYVAGTQAAQEPNIIENIPIKIEGLADGYVVSSMSEETAAIKLRNGGLLFPSLKDKKTVLFVDLSGKKPGEYVVPIKLKSFAGSFEVDQITPAQVSIVIDMTTRKKLPVQIGNTSTQAGDKAMLPISMDPQEVTIVGPSQLVAQAQMAIVAIDSANGGKSNDVTTLMREVQILDKDGKEIKKLTSIPKKIKVTVSYVPAKSVPLSIDTVGMPPAGYSVLSIRVNPSSVYVKGKPEDLKNISTLNTVPVDLNGAMVSFTRDIGLILPRGIFIVDGATPQLSVIISQTSTKRTFDGIKPEILGAKPGVQYKMDPAVVSITVFGNSNDIKRLQLSDIRAVADVSKVSGQQGKVQLDVQVPPGIGIDISPEVSVTVIGVQ